jgi:tripartite ATP-independent transporter DctM subunit
MQETILGFGAIFALAMIRIPLAYAMGIVGFAGIGVMIGWPAANASVAQVVYETGFAYVLSTIPLFILMGNFMAVGGLAEELFKCADAFVGHIRGGLAHATVVASAGFGGPCGSSIATAATMSKVAYPAMRKLGYSQELSTGALAAGGTLGIMIPPSTIMVIYGIITQTNIGKLFAAGIIPGLITTVSLMLGIAYITRKNPALAPAGERHTWAQRWRSLKDIWGSMLLMVVVLGGIYGGVFTSTEGAGIGAAGAFILTLLRGKFTWRNLYDTLVESARTTAMLFTLLISASIFANFVNYTSMPNDLKTLIEEVKLAPILVVGFMMLIYVVLGTIMEELTMVLLTIPLFFPIVMQLGFDPVWFGILIVMVVQIGLISPPVGMNLFVLNSLLEDVKLSAIFRGVWPFVLVLVLNLILFMVFPSLSLWIPSMID